MGLTQERPIPPSRPQLDATQSQQRRAVPGGSLGVDAPPRLDDSSAARSQRSAHNFAPIPVTALDRTLRFRDSHLRHRTVSGPALLTTKSTYIPAARGPCPAGPDPSALPDPHPPPRSRPCLRSTQTASPHLRWLGGAATLRWHSHENLGNVASADSTLPARDESTTSPDPRKIAVPADRNAGRLIGGPRAMPYRDWPTLRTVTSPARV
jgi:hypothetical protein